MTVVTFKVYAYLNAAWTDISADVLSNTLRAQWGMGSNKPFDRLAGTGVLNFSLKNTTGKYSPLHASALSGWAKGTLVKLEFTYAATTFVRFRGTVDKVRIDVGEKGSRRVHVTVLDWMDYAAKYPIVNPDLLEDSRTDEAITTIVAAMPIAPQATSYDTGLSTYPTVFDTVGDYTKAYTEFDKLALSEPGYIYPKKDKTNGETLVFEAMDRRNGLRTLTTVGADILGVINNEMMGMDVDYGGNIINYITSAAYPKRTDTETIVLSDLETPIYFASGETKTFYKRFTNPVGGNFINALTPTNDSYTKSLIHFDGSKGDEIIDETGKLWAMNDVNIENGRPYVRIGSGAGYFDGSASWLETGHSSDWEFGSGDFTIDWWEYRFSATTGRCVTSRNAPAGAPGFIVGLSDGTNSLCHFSSDGVTNDIASAKTFGAIVVDTWVHYAVVRNGSNWYMFKGGTQTDTWTSSAAIFTNTNKALTIGKFGTDYITAMIDEFRISKGIARWTAGFTPQITPYSIEGTFASMWTAANGTGTNLSDNMTLVTDHGTNGTTFTITNGSAYGGWLTNLKTNGYGIYSDGSIDDAQSSSASITSYGYSTANLRQDYHQNLYYGRLEAAKVLEVEKNPRTILNKVYMNANRNNLMMLSFLYLDVGDMVHITETQTAINAFHYIQGVEFSIRSGNIINFGWTLKEAYTTELGLTLMACEFAGGAATDGMNFGYLPLVSDDNATNRIFSAWIYMDSVPTTHDYMIIAPYSDAGGQYFYVATHATQRLLSFYSTRYATTPGNWKCDADAFDLTTWTHVLVHHNLASVTNDPVIYINGVSQALTETSTPAGALRSEVGVNTVIGNLNTASMAYTKAFDGKIKDARIYNADNISGTVADLAAAITAEGAGGTAQTTGMVFQAFAVRTGDVTAYTDLTLTDEKKMLETYLGMVGTANGSPVARTI